MALTLPQLDDRTWQDLVEESRALIPSLAPSWTNFNASDPGITFVELFAWLTETLLYRINRISEPSQRAFLKLIRGPDGQAQGDLTSDIRSVVADLRHCHRAVSAHDFESLAMTVNEQPDAQEQVARAHCLPRRNLEAEDDRHLDAPGHVSLLIMPTTRTRPSEDLLRKVRRILEPARLITTRVHVVAPRFATFGVRITLVIQKDATPNTVRANAVAALEDFFDPLEGGLDGCGWPFGRDVYVSEIYQVLTRVPGVLSVTRTVDPSTHQFIDELVLGPEDNWREMHNRSGELEGLDLQPDELVSAWLDPADIEVKYPKL